MQKSPHSELIDQLGGPANLGRRLREARENDRNPSTSYVSVWRKRSIPWKFRPLVARIASESGISVPVNFLAEGA